jgi:hypothetical protein
MDISDIWRQASERPEAFGIAASALAATISYIAKQISDGRTKRYEARLFFVTLQLRDLYGPLFLLSEANDKTWSDFRRNFRSGQKMFDPPLSSEEKAEYIRWVENVFAPCNEKMRRIIETGAHLFIEGEVPKVVLELVSHFDHLNVVLAKLKDGSSDNVFPTALYPKDFGTLVTRGYASVVQEHSKLTHKRYTVQKRV